VRKVRDGVWRVDLEVGRDPITQHLAACPRPFMPSEENIAERPAVG